MLCEMLRFENNFAYFCAILQSPLLGGVWIEISTLPLCILWRVSHPSWEGCGLKWFICALVIYSPPSPLLGGVWIEIPRRHRGTTRLPRHPSWEGCGLKCNASLQSSPLRLSPLLGGVWIEIEWNLTLSEGIGSPLLGGVWIEIKSLSGTPAGQTSHPSWEGCGLKSVLSY